MHANELSDAVIKDIVTLDRAAAGPQIVEGGNVPFVIVPEGCKLQAVPELIYNDHAAHPERIKTHVNVLDTGAFIEYHRLFSDENSRVFADETTLKVLAVLDYHGAKEGAPRWCQHKLTLELRASEEWKIWFKGNNIQMSQQAFAEFLEQNSLDITSPAPADMREIANDLQAHSESEFGSGIRQSDGQVKFKYTETIKATVGSGAVSVPEKFTLYLPVFIGGDRILMDAFLRFRVNGGKLTFFYTLVRPAEVMRKAFLSARDLIAKELGIVIINGNPA